MKQQSIESGAFDSMDWFCRILKSMEVKEMPTILLAGGAGYIGSHTAVELLSAGYDVIVVDCQRPPILSSKSERIMSW